MPELPEVENIAQGLRAEITGALIERVYVYKPVIVRGAYRKNWKKAGQMLAGQRIVKVGRRAKRLLITTSDKFGIIIQLGMTGKFQISDTNVEKKKHTHFIIEFQDGRVLEFIDVRRFGRIWFFDFLDVKALDGVMEEAGMGRLGPEAPAISKKVFGEIMESRRAVKTLLLDQSRIAGLGNIYADESLFAAGIHPETKACEISGEKRNNLRLTIRRILRDAIRHGGTTFSDFRNAYGEMGRFRKRLKVYQRRGEPCRRCKKMIEKIVLTGRSSHFCPGCQGKK